MNTTTNPLKTAAAKQTTDILLGALVILEKVAAPSVEERMTKAAISDVITERHDLDDLMDEIYMDDDYAGTYTDAIFEALARVSA
jgi:hypothetical protein